VICYSAKTGKWGEVPNMLAAFNATLGVLAALFLGFLVFRFWRVALALLVLAIIGVAGVIGYIFYEDARTARILAEQRASNERIDRAAENRSCEGLPKANEVRLCQIIVTAEDRMKEAEAAKAAQARAEAAQAKAVAEAKAKAEREAAAKAASDPEQAPSPWLPVPGLKPQLEKQSVKEWLKTLEPQ
jgi:parvulin-like peptidyl-prolyl isomerase